MLPFTDLADSTALKTRRGDQAVGAGNEEHVPDSTKHTPYYLTSTAGSSKGLIPKTCKRRRRSCGKACIEPSPNQRYRGTV